MKFRRKLLIGIFLSLLILSMQKIVFADTKEAISNDEKSNNLRIPFTVTSQKKSNIVTDKIGVLLKKIGATLPTSYRTTGLTVKNQKTTGECWAFAYTSAIEAYNLKHSGKTDIYSPRHIDYSCSKSFSDGTRKNSFNRTVKEAGGNYLLASAYALSGYGPVLESDMPFSEDLSDIKLSELDKEVKKQVESYKIFNSIFKKYSGNSVSYYKDQQYQLAYQSDEVNAIRNLIKNQIKENGGILTTIYETDSNKDVYVNNYNNNPNHGVFIVGWDDNYKGSNWNKAGAYIAINSYTTSNFDNGYIYISYDDALVEEAMFAITSVSDVDYNGIYEHDELGFTMAITGKDLQDDAKVTELTPINVFTKSASKAEKLTEIAFGSLSYQDAEIYYTDTFDTDKGLPISFTKIATQKSIEPGYTNIHLTNPIDLKGVSKFAIAVRFTANNQENIASAAIESNIVANKWWDSVDSEKGETYFIINDFKPSGAGCQYYTLSNKADGKIRNTAIKAYTSDDSVPTTPDTIKCTEYEIKGNIITKVPLDTTVDQFKTKVTSTGEYSIVDSDGNKVTGKLKTGYKVIASGKTYVISVVSDISGDGNADIIDIAKLRSHLVARKGFILSGANMYAADLSLNGTVDIIDLARLRKVCTR